MIENRHRFPTITYLPTSIEATAAVAIFILALTPVATAYVGPGAGLGILGTLLAVIIAILASIFGAILWIVRLIIPRRKKTKAAGTENTDNPPEQ